MPRLLVNGQIQQIEQDNLADYLISQGFEQQQFAVALNYEFVPRALYPTTVLQEGDQLELVSPMQGG